MPHSRCRRSVFLILVAALFTWNAILCADTGKHTLDVGAGEAVERLKFVAYQVDVELLFGTDLPTGVVTNPIAGHFTAEEALNRMLEGTPLAVVPVSDGKAFGIINRAKNGETAAPSQQNLPPISTTTEELPKMNLPKRTFFNSLAAVLTLGIAGTPPQVFSQEADESVYELSPFTVESDDNVGYLATSSLAGTRLKSNLRDVAASISVITKEFLADTGATNVNELLVYTSNTEAFGAGGNFTGTTGEEREDYAAQRAEPQRATRIRGLSAADLTRNFYITDIPFDSYNTDRVEINRGANNILFGLGSPAGIINQSTSLARADKSFGEIKTRFDSENSWRAELDYNQVIIEDKLAIRFASVMDNRQFKQEPTFEDSNRQYVALTARPYEGLTIRANYETGDIKANRPNPVGPPESVSIWFNTQKYAGPDADRYVVDGYSQHNTTNNGSRSYVPGTAFDAIRNLPQFTSSMGRVETGNIYNTRGVFAIWSDPNARDPDFGHQNRINQQAQAPGPGEPGYVFGNYDNRTERHEWNIIRNFGRVARRMTDSQIEAMGLVKGVDVGPRFIDNGFTDTNTFDFTNNLISGGTPFQNTDFDAANISLEHLFLNGDLGIEAAFDKQNYFVDEFAPFRSDQSQEIFVENNTFLPTGQPNPNFGRPFLSAEPLRKQTRETERDAFRLTAFYRINLEEKMTDLVGDFFSRFFGEHTITGFYNDQSIDEFRYNQDLMWDSKDLRRAVSNPGNNWDASRLQLGDSANRIQTLIYLGPSIIDAPDFESVRIGRVGNDVKLWRPGEIMKNVIYWDPGTDPRYPGFPAQNIGGAGNPGELEILANGQVKTADFGAAAYTFDALAKLDEIESKALVSQSSWFNDNLIATLGYRDDSSTSWVNEDAPIDAEGGEIITDLHARDGARNSVSDETFSWSVVAHLPREWVELPFGSDLSVHYGESENFQPLAGRVDRFRNPIGNPFGSTEEKGFTLSMFDSKLYVKVNWFETSVSNSPAVSQAGAMVNNILGTIDTFLEQADDMEILAGDVNTSEANRVALLNTADIARKASTILWELPVMQGGVKEAFGNPSASFGSDNFLRNIDGDAVEQPDGIADTEELTAKGMEIELVYNPTSNWRIMANISKQETVRANVAPRSTQFFADFFASSDTQIPGYSGLTMEDIPTSIYEGPSNGVRLFDPEINAFRARGPEDELMGNGSLGNLWYARLQTIAPFPAFLTLKSTEGSASSEQRKWRFNTATNYDFTEGLLKDFSVGGAYRWQDKAAVGYPTIFFDLEGTIVPIGDVNSPYFDGKQDNFDFWVGYRRPLMDGKLRWSIKLNVQNAFASEDGVIVTRTQPNGAPARVRFEPQRLFWLTNTFSF
jgi:outer membrane receptor protein involved in Fe transport